MKFRIVEIKRKYERNFFRPEYKSFLFWNKIADTKWTDTIFCDYKFNSWRYGCLDSKSEAEKCITDFKKWLNQTDEYDVIHNCT
jgi:hypothetical protein